MEQDLLVRDQLVPEDVEDLAEPVAGSVAVLPVLQFADRAWEAPMCVSVSSAATLSPMCAEFRVQRKSARNADRP